MRKSVVFLAWLFLFIVAPNLSAIPPQYVATSTDAAQKDVSGFRRVSVSGTADLPFLPVGQPPPPAIWWMWFEVLDPNGNDITNYGVKLWVDSSDVYQWPALGGQGLPWSMLLSVQPLAGGQLVDFPPGNWWVVCWLYVAEGYWVAYNVIGVTVSN